MKAYFDISKIVWPNPPAIARIRFLDLYTGEKIDPSQFEQEEEKADLDGSPGRRAIHRPNQDHKPSLSAHPHLRRGRRFEGQDLRRQTRPWARYSFSIPENKDHVELIGNGQQANFDMIVGLAVDDNDRLFVTDAKLATSW